MNVKQIGYRNTPEEIKRLKEYAKGLKVSTNAMLNVIISRFFDNLNAGSSEAEQVIEELKFFNGSRKRKVYIEIPVMELSKIVNKIEEYKWSNKSSKEKLNNNIRRRLTISLKSNKTIKNNKTMHYVGCSKKELVEYLESKFKEGMSWLNYGKNGWEIDHILPISSFDLKKEENIYKVMNFKNLQPLWRSENRKKSNKLVYPQIAKDSIRK